ncbi:hypothetical protein [Novosphingobium sp. 28-62-57]|uniref:hypothetical protein n=1 Tax=Novosphingobium sp. 28-62-57 TaxID=1970409 RepID=UPI0025E94AD6|nr:hypothetical protein [Novosphingobium sp. 28-62-57]HQS95419.1 hypothetical protein [Novosphingobium sp.]
MFVLLPSLPAPGKHDSCSPYICLEKLGKFIRPNARVATSLAISPPVSTMRKPQSVVLSVRRSA